MRDEGRDEAGALSMDALLALRLRARVLALDILKKMLLLCL